MGQELNLWLHTKRMCKLKSLILGLEQPLLIQSTRAAPPLISVNPAGEADAWHIVEAFFGSWENPGYWATKGKDTTVTTGALQSMVEGGVGIHFNAFGWSNTWLSSGVADRHRRRRLCQAFHAWKDGARRCQAMGTWIIGCREPPMAASHPRQPADHETSNKHVTWRKENTCFSNNGWCSGDEVLLDQIKEEKGERSSSL